MVTMEKKSPQEVSCDSPPKLIEPGWYYGKAKEAYFLVRKDKDGEKNIPL